MAAPRVSASTVALRTRTSKGYPPNWQMPFKASGNGDFAGSRVNTGAQYSPGTIVLSQKADVPASDTYVTYSGFPAFSLVSKTGYPTNSAASEQMLRRLAVGFRTGDHTGTSVPVTSRAPGRFFSRATWIGRISSSRWQRR